jgi:Protein of unknown function (DUF2442)
MKPIDEQEVEAASKRGLARLGKTPFAISARFDRKMSRVCVLLSTDLVIAFKPVDIEGLENATPTQLSVIVVSPNGLGLHFPAVDADVYLPGLLEGHFGSRKWMAARMGSAGGQVKSEAKSAASRSNGRLGGRPRKPAKDLAAA